MGVVTYEILCEHCGTEFEARSTKRKYCSSKCRTAAHRGISKGDKLVKLMHENKKICDEIDLALSDIRFNRNVKEAWFAIDDLRQRNRQIIAEIANLVAN